MPHSVGIILRRPAFTFYNAEQQLARELRVVGVLTIPWLINRLVTVCPRIQKLLDEPLAGLAGRTLNRKSERVAKTLTNHTTGILIWIHDLPFGITFHNAVRDIT